MSGHVSRGGGRVQPGHHVAGRLQELHLQPAQHPALLPDQQLRGDTGHQVLYEFKQVVSKPLTNSQFGLRRFLKVPIIE